MARVGKPLTANIFPKETMHALIFQSKTGNLYILQASIIHTSIFRYFAVTVLLTLAKFVYMGNAEVVWRLLGSRRIGGRWVVSDSNLVIIGYLDGIADTRVSSSKSTIGLA